MVLAVRIWRILSWVVGAFFLLGAVESRLQPPPGYDEAQARTYLVLCGVVVLGSLLAPFAGLGINRGTKWARTLGWVVASAQTLAVPFITPLGVFGLILIACGAGKAKAVSDGPGLVQRTSNHLSNAILLALLLLTGVPTIDGFFRWAKHLGYPETSYIAVSVIWAGLGLQVLIHEGGHALMGKLVGGHLHHFHIGPFGWRWESGRSWWHATRKASAFGGSVGWTPGDADQLVLQRLLVSAAGVLANLLVALIAIAIFPSLGTWGVPQLWPWAMSLTSGGFILAANLWPTRKGYQDSDGATVFGILTNARFRRLIESKSLESMSESSPLRPREWPRADVEWALMLEDAPPFSSHRSSALLAGCARYLDSGDVTEAVQCARDMHTLAREQPKRCGPSSLPDATFALAFHAGDLDAARDLWARRPSAPAEFELAERLAEASIAGEDRAAEIQRAWECSLLYGSSGTMEYLRDQLQKFYADAAPALEYRQEPKWGQRYCP